MRKVVTKATPTTSRTASAPPGPRWLFFSGSGSHSLDSSSRGFSRNIWSVAVLTKQLRLYKRRGRKRKIGRGEHLMERKTRVEVWKSCHREK